MLHIYIQLTVYHNPHITITHPTLNNTEEWLHSNIMEVVLSVSLNQINQSIWVLWMLTPVLWRVWSHTTTLPSFKTRQIQPLFSLCCLKTVSQTHLAIKHKMMCSYAYVRDCVRFVCFECYLLMLFLKNLLFYWINLESITTMLFWWDYIPGSCNLIIFKQI